VSYRNPVWLWDETHDRDWPADLDFWRTFDTLKRIKRSFTITPSEPGYYRAAVGDQDVNVPAFDIRRWVEDHFHFSNDRTGRYPKDRYCAFGVDRRLGLRLAVGPVPARMSRGRAQARHVLLRQAVG
jgi:hypothetical protein